MKKIKKAPKNQEKWIFTSVNDFLPREGNGISVLAINDDAPGICCPDGKIMNSTWFNHHHKEDKWTHWMYIPKRPMESTEKLRISEIQHKHRVKLPQEPMSYNPSILSCRKCADENGYSTFFTFEGDFEKFPFKADCVGFAKCGDSVAMVSECPKCFSRYYCHAYTKNMYQEFLAGKFKVN